MPSPSIIFCAIGDSRTYGAGASLGCDPVSSLCNQLTAEYENATFLKDNQAVNGTTAKSWLYSDLLPNALASFKATAEAAPGSHVFVQIMLGFNDATGYDFGRCPLPEYLDHMRGIIAAIGQAGIPGLSGIVLHQSYYAVPGGFAPEIDQQCLSDVRKFNTELPSLTDGRRVIMGDQDAYAVFQKSPELMFDHLHASNEGNSVLAALWATAYRKIFSQR